MVASIPVGGRPGSVEVGFDSAWVVNLDDDTVTRVDLQTRAATKTIRVSVGTNDLAAGEGAVWLSNPFDLTVQRIDPEFSRVTDTIELEPLVDDGTRTLVGRDRCGIGSRLGGRSSELYRIDPTGGTGPRGHHGDRAGIRDGPHGRRRGHDRRVDNRAGGRVPLRPCDQSSGVRAVGRPRYRRRILPRRERHRDRRGHRLGRAAGPGSRRAHLRAGRWRSKGRSRCQGHRSLSPWQAGRSGRPWATPATCYGSTCGQERQYLGCTSASTRPVSLPVAGYCG